MTRKIPASGYKTPDQEGNPAREIPEKIQSEPDATGRLDALATRIPLLAEPGEKSRT